VIGVVAAAVALVSCGGGSDAPTATGAQACSPNNPYRGDATAPTKVGSLTGEKAWLRDYFNRNYLWYNEVPNVNAADPAFSNDTVNGFYASIDNYFNALLTPAITASSKFKDQFSFTYPTLAWDQLINSGSSVGYGIEWRLGDSQPPRNIRVVYVHAGSPAAALGVQRGDTLVLADNVSADVNDQSGVDTLNAALFPAAGTLHSFRFSRTGSGAYDIFDLAAGNVALQSVEHRVIAAGTNNVGYLLFNDHVLTAELPLINAVQALANANVNDLVLDLRYNGGGYLYMASQLAYMIAGAARTSGKAFESTIFSAKRLGENTTTPFDNLACLPNANFQCSSSSPLPTLNLSRVYVLVSGSTCSASEAIINGLRGVDVEVRLIGDTTCGKPYGFFGQDNCGITYFPIEFQGINAKGFGDYADGFIPGGTGTPANSLPGCSANDDLGHQLGDPAEGQLAAALAHRASGNSSCPPPMASGRVSPLAAATAERGTVVKAVARSNRYGRIPLR
jgi:hypothetical protein